jgi:hypothetical protein
MREDADDERTGGIVADPYASRFSLPFGAPCQRPVETYGIEAWLVPAHQGKHRVALKETVALRECEAARKLVMKGNHRPEPPWLDVLAWKLRPDDLCEDASCVAEERHGSFASAQRCQGMVLGATAPCNSGRCGYALDFLALSASFPCVAGFLWNVCDSFVAPGLGVDVDGMAVMAEPVDESADARGAREHGRPLLERDIGRDDGGALWASVVNAGGCTLFGF